MTKDTLTLTEKQEKPKMIKRVLIKGFKIGFLTHTGNAPSYRHHEFRCDCGNLRVLSTSHLNQLKMPACGQIGCKYHYLSSKVMSGAGKKDGKRTKEYHSWHSMRARCNNKNQKSYHNYGGRGIKVSDEFSDFRVFLEHVGLAPSPKHSIDRIDNEKGYERDNVRWATSSEQVKNRRRVLSWKDYLIFQKQYDDALQEIIRLNDIIKDLQDSLKV